MKSLIPNNVIRSSFSDFYGESRPAGDTTREFFEFSLLDRQHLVCSIGSVNGNGIATSFTMASLQAFLRGIAPYHGGNAAALIRDLNRIVCEISPDSFYASLFYASIDSAGGYLRYASAGHSPALLVRDKDSRVHRLENTGTVLGLSLRVKYQQRSVPIEPGDLLIAASEGVTDSIREDEILRIAKRQRQARTVSIVNDILDSTYPVRDRTVMVVRIKGRREAGVFQASAEAVVAC